MFDKPAIRLCTAALAMLISFAVLGVADPNVPLRALVTDPDQGEAARSLARFTLVYVGIAVLVGVVLSAFLAPRFAAARFGAQEGSSGSDARGAFVFWVALAIALGVAFCAGAIFTLAIGPQFPEAYRFPVPESAGLFGRRTLLMWWTPTVALFILASAAAASAREPVQS